MNKDILFDRIENGSEVEQDNALDQLYKYVEENKHSPDSLNELALGYQLAKRFNEAIDIYEQLIQSFPEEDVYRLNLATTYSQIPQFELCKYHLRYLMEHGSTDEMRKLAQQQLSGLTAFLGQKEKDQSLRQLQIDSLRNTIASGQGKVEDYQQLGRIVLQMHHIDSNEQWLDEATSVLEMGLEDFPNDVTMMENLVLCYLFRGDDSRLDALLKELEKLAPHSTVFDILNNLDDKDSEQFLQRKLNHAYSLVAHVQSGDDKLKSAALHELQRMVAMARSNIDYRIAYSWALLSAGKRTEALNQALIMEKTPRQTHEFYFNVGQIFWHSGDPGKGKYYLEKSSQYATNDKDKQDTTKVIAELSERL